MSDTLKDLQFKVTTGALEKSKHDKGKRIIRGYASVGNIMDRQGEIITLEALQGAKDDLLRNHTIFLEHKHSSLPVGKTIEVEVDEKGLLITVEFTKASFADDVWQLIEEGILNSFSIGGRVLDSEEKRFEDGSIVNVITKIELFETSVVGIPANPAAKFELVSKSFMSAIQDEIRKKEGKGDMAESKDNLEKEVPTQEVLEETSTKDEVLEVEKTEETTESDVTIEKSEVEQDQTEEVIEAEVEETVEEITKDNTDPEPEISSEETTVEEPVVEAVEETVEDEVSIPDSDVEEEVGKSTDDKILDMLGKILQHLEVKKEDNVTEKSEDPESTEDGVTGDTLETTEATLEVNEEPETTTSNDQEVEVVIEEVVEEVKEDTTEETDEVEAEETEEVLEEKSAEVTLEKTVEVDTEKKLEAKEEVVEEADDLRKSEMIITEPPYSKDETEATRQPTSAELEKLKNVGWSKILFGNK